eukprot:CAMPEP_0204240304 /NCGR_PEP_ID=MMETSP0361-20130328/94816_1 /ASSEMBLY_ACC=CAM_ASM_000343 /TAXON_ID=268821 /ORGANISM="Scrippsiella Hangoei, Strain SHTV-5" /LENGTH=213 /DNA_ID=CAMNT_0051213107 /DNA_START=90 /DNA_END=732 /DNA_ORIENTATION=+
MILPTTTTHLSIRVGTSNQDCKIPKSGRALTHDGEQSHHDRKHSGESHTAEAMHCAAAIDIASRDRVTGVGARVLPLRECFLRVVRQAVRDQLQRVARHHALERLGMAVLQVARAHHEALRRVASVDQVHRRGILVPTGDVSILHARAEVPLPIIVSPIHRHMVVDHAGDPRCHVVEGLRGVLRVVGPTLDGTRRGHEGGNQREPLGHRAWRM